MLAFVFPGQGSQVSGMGLDWFDKYPRQVRCADRILGYSVRELCLDAPSEQLDNTLFTQPALYVVNALAYLDASANARADFLAGHSLGEYSALFAAGALSFADGLRIVQRRAELMAQASGGAMAAVLGLGEARVRQIMLDEGLDAIDVANLNNPTQIVLSGPLFDIEQAQAVFERAGCYAYLRLPVSGAFHSRQMEAARIDFADFLSGFRFAPPRIPVLSNVSARPYVFEQMHGTLAAQMTHAVRWTESVQYLKHRGVRRFVEVGPGKVLAGLIRSIEREAGVGRPEPVA